MPLAPPPVSPNLTVHGQGSLALAIPGNGSQGIDPTALAKEAGAATPCGKLVILMSWRTEGGKKVEFISRVNNADVKVGEGAEGVTSVPGCGVIAVKNGGGGAVTGELRYVVAETT